MARKLIFTVLCLFSLTVFGQNTEGQNLAGAILDSSQLAGLSTPESLVKPMNLWKALRNGSNTHIGLGISPGYNNTTYFKIQKRIGTPNLPFGLYQTIEYATEYKYVGYEPTSPLFRLPFGISYQLSERVTLLAGTDIITKLIYDYNGIRKDLGISYDLSWTQITLGYSFVMGPSLMIGIPVF